ncbi:MAG: hypothetical protein KC503_45070 [Myxococcales bacterium]|nr:hypothetical protein [Myxococcales bacterium]
MNWFIRTLAGAVISGVGWKLGSDAYEVIKKRMQQKKNGSDADSEDADKAGASITGAAEGEGDNDGDTSRRPAGARA